MKNIKYLAGASLALLPILGLFGCDSDKLGPEKKTVIREPWTIGPQNYLKATDKSAATSLQTASTGLATYDLFDEIHFLDFEKKGSVRLQTTAVCENAGTTSSFKADLNLKSSHRLYEFFDISTLQKLLDSASTAPACEISFRFTNTQGDSQKFKLARKPLTLAPASGSLTLVKATPSQASAEPLQFSTVEARDYLVKTSLLPEALHYTLGCTKARSRLKTAVPPFRLDSFDWTGQEDSLQATQPCRVFALGAQKHILAFSPLFILHHGELPLTIHAETHLKNENFWPLKNSLPVSSYVIRNESSTPLVLTGASSSAIVADLVFNRENNKRPYVSRMVRVPVEFKWSGGTKLTVQGKHRGVVPPQGEIRLEVFAPLARIRCGRSQRPWGYYLRSSPDTHIILNVLRDSQVPDHPLSHIGRIDLSEEFYTFSAIAMEKEVIRPIHEKINDTLCSFK